MGSGYALPYYRHDWGLDFLDSKTHIHDARYLLCCYGPETKYLRELKRKFAGRTDAKLAFGLQPHEFDKVLALCSIYIRPTDTDSYGMATRDALEKGLKVIASDVCDRAAGTRLHPVGDRPSFQSLLNQSIHESCSEVIGISNEIEMKKSNRCSIIDWISILVGNM